MKDSCPVCRTKGGRAIHTAYCAKSDYYLHGWLRIRYLDAYGLTVESVQIPSGGEIGDMIEEYGRFLPHTPTTTLRFEEWDKLYGEIFIKTLNEVTATR